MGNLFGKEGSVDHQIYVKTGDRKHADTDANVKIILYDNKGRKSPEIDLNFVFHDDFERGQTDVFPAPGSAHLSDITLIEVWRDNVGISPDWFCEVITVKDVARDKRFQFPILKWLDAGYHYFIPQYNTSLPQFDEYPKQRKLGLEDKRKVYQLTQNAPGLPVQLKKVPDDELFSDEYKRDLANLKAELNRYSKLPPFTTGRWERLIDITDVYKYSNAFPVPTGKEHWNSDAKFGAQRLVGCNTRMIRLCTALPENMAVTAEMLQPFLDGRNIQQMIYDKRLFVVDFKILAGLPTKDDNTLCAPIGLFFLNGDKQLMPIAIQLQQEVAADNPVFLPNDDPFTWTLAKMWFNLADATVHQSHAHLAFTHLLMEGISVATHRHLATNHPIFKLLAPHFLYLLTTNARGNEVLISQGGWVDKTTTVGRAGMLELIRRGLAYWRIDVHGTLQSEIDSRGVLDPKVLPNYPYRDDGILVWNTIENYVTRIIKHYYDTPEKIKEDNELHAWIALVARPKKEGGVGIQGTPNNGQLKTAGDIVSVCTSIIFTCSAQHATANFCQYDEYGFPPNYPALLTGDPPRDKSPRSEEDVVKTLPDKATTLDTMTVTKVLSMKGTLSLGNWELRYQYDPPALEAEDQFREQIELVSKAIQSCNRQREPLYVYTLLDPAVIPNAISI